MSHGVFSLSSWMQIVHSSPIKFYLLAEATNNWCFSEMAELALISYRFPTGYGGSLFSDLHSETELKFSKLCAYSLIYISWAKNFFLLSCLAMTCPLLRCYNVNKAG